ncbi:solute:sodium symporter family transporter [Intestinibacillus massiliensis]|uniref:solute:sodium symporter family transporter n=1 Tax=Intestinibacillus massiliensis TaxID=1871029 RepID=UPI000B364ABE|nr:solute:sodium symporter family transporter [Intestinibacillus massiliensis]MCB6366573.1 solute:sodium symporter family transporter [Intestinibacillus massiliensis]
MEFFQSVVWTVISFLLFTVGVAVISSWKTRGDNLETAEGYFLAGRGLPGIVIAGSLLLTNLSAEQLVGLNGQSWKTNMGPIAWEVGSMFTLLALAFYFLPKYLKMGAMTIPSLMEERYGKGTKTMFSLVIVIMYSILNLPVILYSGAVVFEQIFDISGMLGMSKFGAVAVLCVIIGIVGGCYAIFGGLKAVAVSDTINGVGLIIGGLLIPFLGFAALAAATGGDGILDGVRYILDADPAKLNAINAWNAPEPEVPWPLLITGMFFSNLYWWCTNQSFVQRSLAAKSLKEGQKGAIFCGFLKCLGPMYLVIPGIIAFYLPTIQDKLSAAGASAIDFAYPALIAEIVPKPVMGFFAAVMFGAILSSFNSVLNSASTMFTLDLYRSSINPKASDVKCVKVGKVYGTIAGCVAIVIAPFIMNATGITTFLNSMSQFVSLPVLCTILGVFLFKRLPKYTPKVITAVHVVCYAAFLLLKPCYPGSENPIHYLYAMAVLFPVELIIMWFLNKYRPAEAYQIKDVGAVDLTPWKYRYVVAGVGVLIAIGIYVLFSPLGIAA